MTYDELSSEVLDLVDLDSQDVDTTRLSRAINRAYAQLVVRVEDFAGEGLNLSTAVPVLTVPATPVREYDLYDSSDVSPVATDVRKVVGCDLVEDDGRRKSVPIVPFAVRNEWVGRPESGRSAHASKTAVYVFHDADDHWNLGFVYEDDKAAEVYEVRYRPIPETLSTGLTPKQVPATWHHLIALKAAMRLKVQENRDITGLERLYAEGLVDMREDLETQVLAHATQLV
jgi:hypothetical protein